MLEQDPAAGTELAKGKTVALVVAKAPAELPVPDVDGLTEDDATQALEDAGFEVTTEDGTADVGRRGRAGDRAGPGGRTRRCPRAAR